MSSQPGKRGICSTTLNTSLGGAGCPVTTTSWDFCVGGGGGGGGGTPGVASLAEYPTTVTSFAPDGTGGGGGGGAGCTLAGTGGGGGGIMVSCITHTLSIRDLP